MERELAAIGHSVRLLQPPPCFGRLAPALGKYAKWLGYIDKFILFPITLRFVKRTFDIVHICDHSNSMYIKDVESKPHIITCHDVLAIKSALGEVPENEVSATGKKFQEMILNGLRRASSVICDSIATLNDMQRVTGRRPGKDSVVYLSLNYPYSPMDRVESIARLDALGFNARMPFFVHVGGTVWYKNKRGVLQIFSHLRNMVSIPGLRLLMLGKPLSSSLIQFIKDNGLEGVVDTFSNVSNEDLRAAYSLSAGLIFPSLQEGFGWPVLEAQACGCPVFTTGRPPMTEIGADAAVYFDPADPKRAAEIIAKALESTAVMRQKGLENAARFTEANMIKGYLNAYELEMKLDARGGDVSPVSRAIQTP